MAFPKSEQNLAFSALILAIKNDPVMRRELKTLQTWTGERPIPPATGDLPYLRLKPRSAPNQDWANPCWVRQDLLIDVETVCDGSDVRAAMDLWRAVLSAIFPADQDSFIAVWGRLKAAGINTIHPVQGPVDVKETSTGLTVVGTGQLRLDIAVGLKNLPEENPPTEA